MDYVTLPGTDLRVSRVCLGTMQFAGSQEKGTRDVTWGAIDQATVNATVSAALKAGVNFFDCAEAYGQQRQAEKALGIALKGKREHAVIASKFGRHMALWETDDPTGASVEYDAAAITAAIDASLEALQTDYVDLYQVHWPANCSSFDECVTALNQAQQCGKIKHYGVCNFGTTDLANFMAAGGKPISNQVPYNLLWRAIEHGVIQVSSSYGLTILPYSPLQQGLLAGRCSCSSQVADGRRRTRIYRADSSSKTMHGSPGAEQAVFAPNVGVLAQLRELAEGASVTMAELALGWLLSRRAVGAVLVGASSPAQMARNALMPRIAPEVLAKCDALTEDLKQQFFSQGNVVDQYARTSRIHGNSFEATARVRRLTDDNGSTTVVQSDNEARWLQR